MHVCGAPDKFRGFLFTRLENSFLRSYLCISRAAWNEPKRSFISRQRAYRSQNIPLLCYPSPRKTAGLEVKGQGRDEASLCKATACSTWTASPVPRGFSVVAKEKEADNREALASSSWLTYHKCTLTSPHYDLRWLQFFPT